MSQMAKVGAALAPVAALVLVGFLLRPLAAGEPVAREGSLDRAKPAAVLNAVSPDAVASAQARVAGAIEATVSLDGRAPSQPWIVEARPHDWFGDDRALRVATDAGGVARFDRVPTGSWVILSDRGGIDDSIEVEVSAGCTTRADLSLARGFRIEGEVVDRAGRPIADTEIFLTRLGRWDEDFVVARSDRDGRFTLDDVAGLAYVGARASGRAGSLLHVLVADRSEPVRRVHLVLAERGGAIAGRVVGPDGAPLANARVLVDADGFSRTMLADGSCGIGLHERIAWSGADGTFRVESISAGEHKVVVRSSRCVPFVSLVRVHPDVVAELAVTLVRGAVVTGRVRTAEGAPVEGAIVSSGRGTFFSESSIARSGRDGSFRLEGLPTGELVVFANASELGMAQAIARAVLGAETQVDLRLERDDGLVDR